MAESSTDRLWKEYSRAFEAFDDLTLARWLAQTLGQLQGRVWRFSHPLASAFRLAAEVGHDRQIWHKRLVDIPAPFIESPCCRAPLLPLFTRDILETGLVCQHCAETAVPFDEIPIGLRQAVQEWASEYGRAHSVAHWDDRQRRDAEDYDQDLDDAADRVEELLIQAGRDLIPKFLDYHPAIIWEDQDECLEVHPDDIQF